MRRNKSFECECYCTWDVGNIFENALHCLAIDFIDSQRNFLIFHLFLFNEFRQFLIGLEIECSTFRNIRLILWIHLNISLNVSLSGAVYNKLIPFRNCIFGTKMLIVINSS